MKEQQEANRETGPHPVRFHKLLVHGVARVARADNVAVNDLGVNVLLATTLFFVAFVVFVIVQRLEDELLVGLHGRLDVGEAVVV